MTTLTCGQCRQTFDTETGPHACPVAFNFTHNPKPNSTAIVTRPISVAAAEHLATVETERDELRNQLRTLWAQNHKLRLIAETFRDLAPYGGIVAQFARSPIVTDLLGEP